MDSLFVATWTQVGQELLEWSVFFRWFMIVVPTMGLIALYLDDIKGFLFKKKAK